MVKETKRNVAHFEQRIMLDKATGRGLQDPTDYDWNWVDCQLLIVLTQPWIKINGKQLSSNFNGIAVTLRSPAIFFAANFLNDMTRCAMIIEKLKVESWNLQVRSMCQ